MCICYFIELRSGEDWEKHGAWVCNGDPVQSQSKGGSDARETTPQMYCLFGLFVGLFVLFCLNIFVLNTVKDAESANRKNRGSVTVAVTWNPYTEEELKAQGLC